MNSAKKRKQNCDEGSDPVTDEEDMEDLTLANQFAAGDDLVVRVPVKTMRP